MCMIITARASERNRRAVLFDQMFALRARQFRDRRRWQVNVQNGKEVDQFDDCELVYVMMVSPSGELVASARLIPTLGPHMLSEAFAEALCHSPLIRDALVWEVSRFVVNTAAIRHYGANGLNRLTGELLLSLFKTARAEGLKQLVAAIDPAMGRLLRRAGCGFEEIGRGRSPDGSTLIAGLFDVSAERIDRLNKQLDGAAAGRSVLRFRRERLGICKTMPQRAGKRPLVCAHGSALGAFVSEEVAAPAQAVEHAAHRDAADPGQARAFQDAPVDARTATPAEEDCFVTLFDRHLREVRRAIGGGSPT